MSPNDSCGYTHYRFCDQISEAVPATKGAAKLANLCEEQVLEKRSHGYNLGIRVKPIRAPGNLREH
jgi:hypothetical protein